MNSFAIWMQKNKNRMENVLYNFVFAKFLLTKSYEEIYD